jgi:peptide methionine sulfoxide reductase msrA/msrB
MKNYINWYSLYGLIFIVTIIFLNIKDNSNMAYNKLSNEEQRIILHKGTEAPYSGKFYKHNSNGIYVCKQCNSPLYESSTKFNSGCGWPSFDDNIKGAVKRVLDKDGRRIEIVCANCDGHLGHVFNGEQFTPKNTRHCVNSVSIDFSGTKETKTKEIKEKKAYFTGGCFWGVEYHFEKLDGVISAVSGYQGGDVENPTYEQVCSKNTGHLEVVEVTYDPNIVSYETLVKLFFEIHDPEQPNGQGPDIGPQYLSGIFTDDEKEREIIQKLANELTNKGYNLATKLLPMAPFYKAEKYHQNYYKRNRQKPYCHTFVKRF